MEYISKENCYICKNNRKLNLEKEITKKYLKDIESKISIYSCNDCSKISFEDRVKRMKNSKIFLKLRNENLDRIASDIEVQFRGNRSI